jgi:hypothetical protein
MVLLGGLGVVSAPAWGFDLPKPKKDKPKQSEDSTKSSDGNATTKPDGGAAPAQAPAAPNADELTKTIEALVDKALAAYNADDPKAFFADYCKSMASIATEQTFTSLYRNMYRPKLGNYVSRSLVKSRSTFSADSPGIFFYDEVFEKDKTASIAINYVKEDGVMKLMQVQFKPSAGTDTAPPASNPATTTSVHESHAPRSSWEKSGMGSSKIGDFVEYEYPAVVGMKNRQEVVEIGDHTLTLESTSNFNGKKTTTRVKMIFSEPDGKVEGKNVEVKEFPDSATVPKGMFTGTRYESYIDGKLTGKSWMSKDVPVTGIVKVEGADGKVAMILTDYGRGK